MRTLAIIAAVLVALAVGTAGLFGFAYMASMPYAQSSGPRPGDAEMLAHWHAHRAALEQLVAMLAQDPGLKRLGPDWSDPEQPSDVGVPPERIALYRKLFREAAILSAGNYGPQVELRYYTQGIIIRGSSKGFCYGPPPDYADQIDGDLDRARDALTGEARRDFTLQRHIEGEWWLQYDGT